MVFNKMQHVNYLWEMIPKIMDSFYTNISKPKKLTTVFLH